MKPERECLGQGQGLKPLLRVLCPHPDSCLLWKEPSNSKAGWRSEEQMWGLHHSDTQPALLRVARNPVQRSV